MIRATRWLGSGGARSRAVVFGAAYAFACGCFLLAWSLASGGQQKPAPGAIKAVTAERFVLVDRDGRERAKLGLDASGSPSLDLIDAKGESRVILRLDRDGAATVRACDADGRPRAGISVQADGSASVLVMTPEGRVAGLGTDDVGSVNIQTIDVGRKPVWFRGIGPEGQEVSRGD